MVSDINVVVLILDMCMFLKKQDPNHWDSFISYYLNELKDLGFDTLVDKRIIKRIVRFNEFEKPNVYKDLVTLFGPTYKQYYDFYINRTSVIDNLAREIKKKYFVTDCSEALLCDIWGVTGNDERFNCSVKELLAKGYSSEKLMKVYSDLDDEKSRAELHKRKKTLIDSKPESLNDTQIRLYKFFERCDIYFKDEKISDESIIQALEAYYINLIDSSEHITSLTLHTGSICYQIVGVVVIALLCILNNDWDNESILSSLAIGDSVLYDGNKYIFDGVQEIAFDPKKAHIKSKCFVLSQSKTSKTYVPCENHPAIYPYKGTAVTNKGYKSDKKERTSFLKETMDYSEDEITGVISSSAIIVMGKSAADEIIKNISLRCSGKSYSLTDIIRISYFTDSNKDIRYKGNADQNESSIKICPSLSVASEQISQFSDKERIAIAVFDERILTRDLSNMDLFLNNDLNYSFVSTPINTDTAFELVEHSERRTVFACTKNFLLNNIVIGQTKEGEIGAINRQITAVIDKEIECVALPEEQLNWERVVATKKQLKRLASNDYSNINKDQFVVYAHSILNFYLTSVFSNLFVEQLCKSGIINVDSPSVKHDRLLDLLISLPEEIQSEGMPIIDYLNSLKELFDSENAKQVAMERIINSNRDNKILILVPKAYYEPIIKYAETRHMSPKGDITVSTYKKVDKTKFYDLIIVVGQFGSFDPELCLSASKVYYLLYDGERKFFDYREKENRKKLRLLNNELSSTTDYIIDSEDVDDDYETARTVELSDAFIENELSSSVFESQLNNLFAREFGSSKPGHTSIKVKYAAALEDGRRVLFTQYYKAYVYEDNTESIVEKSVNDLCSGDMIVFTSQKSATLDVIDDILSDNIESLSASSQQSYQLTLRWKQILKKYLVDNNISINDLGNLLKEHGIKVEPQTVRVWIDDYSHIICPQDPDSLRAIGDLLEDDDLKHNYKEYFESGKIVKKIRANIRQVVRTVIFSKMTNTTIKSSDGSQALKVVEQYVSDNYSNLFDIGVLESITEIEQVSISTNAINRPIELQEV